MELALLETLVVLAELSGKEIAERYRETTKKAVPYGTLYSALRRLKQGGWVKVREGDNDARERHFILSDKGLTAMQLVKLINQM